MTASFFCPPIPATLALSCYRLVGEKGDFSIFLLPCEYWIIYLLANSQHCQHGVVKIYLCPDRCVGRPGSDYSLLPDILLDAVPVYTAVNHCLPITQLHKTRLEFKSGPKTETETAPACYLGRGGGGNRWGRGGGKGREVWRFVSCLLLMPFYCGLGVGCSNLLGEAEFKIFQLVP